MLYVQGETAKYVGDQMGHSSIQVTFGTYGHLFPQPRREAAQKLQAPMPRGKDKANYSGLVAVQNISAKKRSIREEDGG
jgi:hypothetical protein